MPNRPSTMMKFPAISSLTMDGIQPSSITAAQSQASAEGQVCKSAPHLQGQAAMTLMTATLSDAHTARQSKL